ncbi:MAG: helix-turn-helix domain-containing protein [Alishewanella agri]|jgi:transcriptional regulator with XRE-family HTH domain|uniref:Transcriptional regulator n=1 Tax=Alishewanella jeotgali KCTC 22429 TaxID=1129374 RepID=H3ZDB6_9ALTE|nr:helix-turn-helix domain-containing protein [Alishewanella jeotgali]EHR41439.1 transcriptional regulator [Alishewanella jeotgali KCTC 22429]MDD4865117.1 helix-turn-helix domain-containing protein [Alishewanella agri]OYW93654.1 MAG: transcriptional regulator [Alishewanella sp. 32-51-5]
MAKKVTASNMPNSVFIENAEILGQLIKAKRTELGIKLADCAALCGIGINTLSRIENGNANCTLAAVFSVLNGLGIKLTSKELTTAANSSSAERKWI